MTDINFQTAQFMISAPSIRECPAEEGGEVAFAGRSNAGKSSALNILTNNKKLARTSKTPGRTQLLNFYKLHNTSALRLVDLPGYGYARVPMATKKRWQNHLARYLFERQSLKGLILLMDIRHPLQESDAMMIHWAVEAGMPVHALLTKSDKLKRGPATRALAGFRQYLRDKQVDDRVSGQNFSALRREGLGDLRRVLNIWLTT